MPINEKVFADIFSKPPEGNKKYILVVDDANLQEKIWATDYYAMLVDSIDKVKSISELISASLGGYVKSYVFFIANIRDKAVREAFIKTLNDCCMLVDTKAYKIFYNKPEPIYLSDSDIKTYIEEYIATNIKTADKLETINAADLQNKEIAPINWIVNNLLTSGETLLTAASKIGKSWLALDLSLNVAKGEPFLGRKTQKTGVLYLALEDSERRLKNRMNKLLKGENAPDNLYFMTKAKTLDMGLIGDLEAWLKSHSDVKVIIIDTFQKIRSLSNNKNSYASDYEDMGRLKEFADKHDIAVMLVHHNRKSKDDDDVFNMISGTNAIMGAADTIIVLTKGKRTDVQAKMHITGRDVIGDTLVLEFDKQACKWHCIGNEDAIEVFKEREEYNNNPIVITIRELMKQSAEGWKGTATDLQEAVMKYGGEYLDTRSIGRSLRDIQQQLYEVDKIIYKAPSNSSNGKRYHIFKPIPINILNINVANDANDVNVVNVANVAN